MFFSKKKRRARKAEKEAQRAAEAVAALREQAAALSQHGGRAAANQAAAMFADVQQFTQKKAVPAVKDFGKKTAKFASDQLDNLEPHIKGALDKVTPAVDSARAKVADDYLPKVQEFLHNASDTPVVGDVAEQSAKGLKQLRKDIAPKPKRGFWGWTGRILLIGTLLAGVGVAVRRFLAPKDDGWTAHEPSKAYVNNTDTFATAAKVDKVDERSAESDKDKPEGSEVPEAHPGQADEKDAPVADLAEATDDAAEATDEAAAAVDEVAKAVDGAAEGTSDYGPGSYVGENPPEGFAIKGNERSKKYHVEGSGGYERTIAEVWFNSEDAAKAAGFTRAQR